MLHTAGDHFVKKGEIIVSTFTLDNAYNLAPQSTRVFEDPEANGVLAVQTQPETDLYEVLVVYKTLDERGKILKMNMKEYDEDAKNVGLKATTYYFMNEMSSFDGNAMKMNLYQTEIDNDYILYGGSTNYMRGTGDLRSIVTDWTDQDKKFGFFMVWTSNQECYSGGDRDLMLFGTDYKRTFERPDDLRVKWAQEDTA